MRSRRFAKLCLTSVPAVPCLAYEQEAAPPLPKTIVATIDTPKVSEPISKYENGMFIEHIGSLIYRSLWSEMPDDRKFYYPISSKEPDAAANAQAGRFRRFLPRRWRPVGPDRSVLMDKDHSFVGDQSPRVELDPSTPHGVRQSGLALVKGKRYTGHIILRGTPGASVKPSLMWGEGPNDRETVSFSALPNEDRNSHLPSQPRPGKSTLRQMTRKDLDAANASHSLGGRGAMTLDDPIRRSRMPERRVHFGLRVVLIVVAATVLNLAVGVAQSDLKLTYDKPAAKWTEALPIGNGRIGAMVFGGTEDERLQINESTLWGGGPHNYTNPEAYAHLGEIRHLIFAGKVDEAEKLSAAVMGQPKMLMAYQPFCDMRLHFTGHQRATEYRRELHLDDAIAETTYKTDSATFRREVFISYPDQILVVRITASQPGQVTFSVGMNSPHTGTHVESIASDTLQLTGQIQPRQNPARSWTGSWDQPGMRFAAVLKVLADGGSVRGAADSLEISDANSVTILFSNATSFRDYQDIGGDALGAAQAYVQRASKQSYDRLRQRHIDDVRRLFSRAQLRLGGDHATETTDWRIKAFAENDDPSLLALYFEFGRYLLISSSRPGGQPANLQGIWNEALTPPWSSKWTTNINLEMNYWQADTGDLWESEEPLWNLIRDLRVTGAEAARVHYHSKGWVLHHNTDLWRATTPVDGPWGVWPMGQAWLANQMWDHYEFSRDREFLRHQAYPAMKEAAEFALGVLVEAPAETPFAGRLVTNPSTSPENQYLLNGKPEHLTYAATMDIELIRELFENCWRAAKILGTDAEFRAELDRAEKRLPPLQIGKRGQLQEWIEDYPEAEPAHRHVSHLYALYPGYDIGLKTSADLAAAAAKTLELRGDGGTGWSTVWRVALWARLHNPERAYANLRLLITMFTLPNMYDLCPPFQIDGNLGGPAAITEMLIQSTPDEISVLPALPRQWPSGSLRGVRVRGGGKVDVVWKEGRLTELKLQSDHAMKYRMLYGDQSAEIQIEPGKPIVLDGALHSIGS